MSEGRVTTVQGEGVRIRVNNAGQLELETEDVVLVFTDETAMELIGEIAGALNEHRRPEKLAAWSTHQARLQEGEKEGERERGVRKLRRAKSPQRWQGQRALLGSDNWVIATKNHYDAHEAAVSLCHQIFADGLNDPVVVAASRDRLERGITISHQSHLWRVVEISISPV